MNKKLLLTVLAAGLVFPTATANAEDVVAPGKLTAQKPTIDEAQLIAALNNGGHLDQGKTQPQDYRKTPGANEGVDANGVLTQNNSNAITHYSTTEEYDEHTGKTTSKVTGVLYGQTSDENSLLYPGQFTVVSKNGKEGTAKIKQPVAVKQADGTYKYEVKESVVKVTFDEFGNAHIVPGQETGTTTDNKDNKDNNGDKKGTSEKVSKAIKSAKSSAKSSAKTGAKKLPKTSATK